MEISKGELESRLRIILNDAPSARITALKSREILNREDYQICGFILYNKTTGDRVTVDMGKVQWYNNNTLNQPQDWMFGSSIEARNALQQSGTVHPYTCYDDSCRSKTNGNPLRAVEDGWICDDCGLKQ